MDPVHEHWRAVYNSAQRQASRSDADKASYLNYGYKRHEDRYRHEPLEKLQKQLCQLVFDAAEIEEEDHIIDVGFGSGAQDFLLAQERRFARLIGFNTAEEQVEFARLKATRSGLTDKLDFRLGRAEELPGIEGGTQDKMLAIECAFHFERPLFYRRAAQVLRPGGLLILADISYSDHMKPWIRLNPLGEKMGVFSENRAEWEKRFSTEEVRCININVLAGAQLMVHDAMVAAAHDPARHGHPLLGWALAGGIQAMVHALLTGQCRYDLIVLKAKPEQAVSKESIE